MNHNSREFNAKNTDPERTYLNTEYCNEKIKNVYRELFDDALQRYNQKQKRADRKIENYYEKIRSGRQEKTFHEIIIQVGNCENMNSKTPDGELAEKILDEYYQDFQKRNAYFSFANAFLNNTISVSQLERAMVLGKLGEQVVAISEKAFNSFEFIEAIASPNEIYLPKKLARDSAARDEFRKEKSRGSVVTEKYIMDIIREGWKNDDERLQRVILG